jgi:hypothetical protein
MTVYREVDSSSLSGGAQQYLFSLAFSFLPLSHPSSLLYVRLSDFFTPRLFTHLILKQVSGLDLPATSTATKNHQFLRGAIG